jgi:hypothetical protein
LNIINTGDLSTTNEIQTPTITGNTLGLSGTATTVTVPNIYTADGTLIGDRSVLLGTDKFFEIKTSGPKPVNFNRATNRRFIHIDAENVSNGAIEMSGGTNSLIYLDNSRVRILTNGVYGETNQVLTSGFGGTYWSDNPAWDNLYQESGPSISSWSHNADGGVFGTTSTTTNINSISSTTFRKGASNQMYEVKLILRSTSMPGQGTNGKEGGYITIGLYRGSTQVGTYGCYNVVGTGDEQHDLTFTFLTDTSGTDYTFRNISGSSIDAVIKRIIINRIR